MWADCMIDGVPTISCLEPLFENILAALGGIVFLILFAMFVSASFNWLTAGDNAEKLKKARATFVSAIVGMLVIASAYLVLKILESILGLNLTQFSLPK